MLQCRLNRRFGLAALLAILGASPTARAVTVRKSMSPGPSRKSLILDLSKPGPIAISALEKQGLALSRKTGRVSDNRSLTSREGQTLIHGPSDYFATPFAVVIGNGADGKNSVVTFEPEWGLSKVVVPNELTSAPASPADDYEAFDRAVGKFPPVPLVFTTFNGKELTKVFADIGSFELSQHLADGTPVYAVR